MECHDINDCSSSPLPLPADDYVTGIMSVRDGSYTQCLGILILDNSDVEPTEDFSVVLTPVSPFVEIGTASSAVVTITDDDSECLSLINDTLNKDTSV